jgi:uncharacterized Zn finger protein (UPF0148 family)
MVDLLRQGATLTELSCPACSSPIFRLQNQDLWCARCQKQVVIVKDETTPLKATELTLFSRLESTILAKIQELNQKIQNETDSQKLYLLTHVLSLLLENLERIRKIK